VKPGVERKTILKEPRRGSTEKMNRITKVEWSVARKVEQNYK
jgi:hypothetical protein